MKKLYLIIMAVAVLLPAVAQEPMQAEPAEKPEALEVPEAIEEPEATEAPEALEAPEATEVPEAAEAPESVEAPESDPYLYGDTVRVGKKVEVIDNSEKTRVTLGKNEVIIVEENGDTVVVGLGNKGISIVEGDDGVVVHVLDMDEKRDEIHKESHHKKKRFDPHWAGFKVGLNNYLTPDFSMVLPAGQEFMDLNTGKSWNWNLDVADIGLGFGTSYVGLVSGLGFEFINYNFDGQNNIMKDPVTRETVEYIPTYAGNITKSKLNATYMTAPLLLEFQIPTGGKRIFINGGVIGGLKLWSNTKIKYRESGEKSKEKRKGDYNLAPLRWGVAASVGYGDFSIWGRYYITSLFKPEMGPELYPFALGIAVNW